jgi:putative hydrolase of the HAD superfamily
LKRSIRRNKDQFSGIALEYWSKKTNINLSKELLKTKNKIKVFPGAIDFLQSLKRKNIKIILLTNCPREMLNVKITQCKLWGYFNKIISSEDYEFAKETDEFWKILEEKIFFNKNKTVFIDDNQDVLRYSYRNGIKNLVSINFPDSNEEKKSISKFLSIDSISLFNPEIIK